MCSSTTTTERSLPEKSETEKRLDGKALELLDTYMETQGYDVNEKVVSEYKNPDKVASLETQLSDLDTQIAAAEEAGPSPYGQKIGQAKKISNLDNLKNKRNQINSQLENEKTNATTSYEYSYDLNEVGLEKKRQSDQALEYQGKAQEAFFETYKKFAIDKDYSITEDQRQLIDAQMEGIRGPVTDMLNEIEAQYEQTGQSMGVALDEYITEIQETGLSAGAALSSMEDRIKTNKEGLLKGISAEEDALNKTGKSVRAALQGVRDEINNTGDIARDTLEDTFQLKSMLIDRKMTDMYDQQRKAVAEKASRLGRSPTDPRFQLEMQQQLAKNIETAQLQLAVEEMSMLSGLEERTGQRREQLGMTEAGFEETQGRGGESIEGKRTGVEAATGEQLLGTDAERAALQERTGQRMEGAQAQKMAIAERTGAGKEAVAGQKAALEEGLQKYGVDQENLYGVGIPASQIGLGMDVAGYQQALQAQGAANIGSGMTATSGLASGYQAERMAQPTTTTTEKGSIGGAIFGGLGALAGGAGSILGGIGSLGGTK